MGMTVPSAV
uniref:Uncharacterized protein n=1 Tax=Arundo donax TaxID=35708 RepID=A0A0A9HCL3_ARUDO